MQISTILVIILAAFVALAIVLFQYYYKSKKRDKLTLVLSFLRFISLFGIAFLLINPEFVKSEYSLEKTNLIVVSDNSTSLKNYENDVLEILTSIKANKDLSDKFNLDFFRFGNKLQAVDSLDFSEKNTNITATLKELQEVYSNSNAAIVLLTDGNQTIGEDYQLFGVNAKSAIYPIAVGDTVQYEDLRIDNVNANKYAFLKNKYPIEVDASYFGEYEVSSTITISSNGRKIHQELVKLSKKNNAKTIRILLNANSIGVKQLEISISSTSNERNTLNNNRNIAVEVIDEKLNITIVSSMTHPDLGALKKAIESNEQRVVSIKAPSARLADFEKTDVFLLYQPSPAFKSIYDLIRTKKMNSFTVLGAKVDRNFLNRIQNNFAITGNYPVQETLAVLNSGFSKFDISDFDIVDFPPLNNGTGVVKTENGESLLQMNVLGNTFDAPLLATFNNDEQKELVLFGEHIWKWRMQSYRNQQNFENFDNFIGKLMRYLSDNEKKNRLNLEYEAIYEGNNSPKIRATYFDETFVFDPNASLTLFVQNKKNGTKKEIPMLLKNGFYEADLRDMPAAEYGFTVTETKEKRSKSGIFTILDFDIEKQFSSTNYKKLNQLALATDAKLYFPESVDQLLQNLNNKKEYTPTQKRTKNIVSLIDFRILLVLIATVLALEWLIRKYNGLT